MPVNDQAKILTFGRCKYLTKTGRRCRSQIVYPDGRYCRQHILTQESKDDFELLLTDQALRFRHTRGIHNSLQRLYGLLAAGEISPRRAATLAYISNLLIRHLPDAIQSDSRACRCTGFPHARHEVYPAPAPQTIATENIATETKSAPHKPDDNRDHHRNANHNGAAASDLHAPSAEFTTPPESTNVN